MFLRYCRIGFSYNRSSEKMTTWSRDSQTKNCSNVFIENYRTPASITGKPRSRLHRPFWIRARFENEAAPRWEITIDYTLMSNHVGHSKRQVSILANIDRKALRCFRVHFVQYRRDCGSTYFIIAQSPSTRIIKGHGTLRYIYSARYLDRKTIPTSPGVLAEITTHAIAKTRAKKRDDRSRLEFREKPPRDESDG